MKKSLIFFATYNEAGNVAPLLASIGRFAPDADILVVDDSSTDGTVEAMRALQMPRLRILVRKGKLGLGTAHLLALAYACGHDYDVVVTMDGDLSHDPAHLPSLLKLSDDGADLVIGSRYMPGGMCDYTGYRRNVSILGNIAARFMLGIKLHEFTTSYRAFKVAALRRMDFSRLLVGGYSFFLTMVAEAASRGFRIEETPIHFRERGYGTSKIPPFEAIRGILNLVRLSLRKRLLRKAFGSTTTFMPCTNCQTPYSFIGRNVPAPSTGEPGASGTCVFCGFHIP
jgi:dolichol-phosphate mannosyltransferase